MAKTRSKKAVPLLKSKLKKDPGIPKLPDIKERLRIRRKLSTPPIAIHEDADSAMASEPTLSTLVQLASSIPQPGDPSSPLLSPVEATKDQVRKYYLKTLRKVIDESDIIVLVLDARDPEGCRSRLVEEEVRRREAEGKRLVFVLNKIDLVPKSNAQNWLKHLRHSAPTLPFRSASQNQRSNLSSSTAPALLKLLKAYGPKAGSVTVGVVGYPNVGKSSLINSLKRSKVCAVAAQPGHTKDIQCIQLERGMKIIDSPGVVFDDDDYPISAKKLEKGSVLLRNAVKAEDIEDPIAVVEEILNRIDRETIKRIYKLPDYNTTLHFLTMLAVTTGKLLKGGTPDLNSAARQVLTDWNHQKIPYFSTPPALHPSHIPSTIPNPYGASGIPIIAPGAENVGHAQILNSFSKPFVLDGLFGAADAGAFGGNGDVIMADEDGDGGPMDQDVSEDVESMKIDVDSTPGKSRKRKHPPAATPAPNSNGGTDLDRPRESKRQRKAKDVPGYHDPPDQHALSRMERSNPLSRKNLKKEAKRTRRARRLAIKAEKNLNGDAPEVDHTGLQFTFMA